MKRITVFLAVMGMLLAVSGDVSAQITDGLFGYSRAQRAAAADRHGWGYGYGYNTNLYSGGSLFGNYSIGQFGRGQWAPVIGQAAVTIGNIVTNSQDNNTIRQVAGEQAQLEGKRIDNEHEIALRREDRTDATLQVKLKQSEGRYTYEMTTVPQSTAPVQVQVQPQKTSRTLHNESSCKVGISQNGQLVFVLHPHTPPIPILGGGYNVEEMDGCSIQVDNQGDKIVISPGRR